MKRRFVALASVAVLMLAMVPAVSAQDAEKPNIAFLPGVEDPFYRVMEKGIEAGGGGLRHRGRGRPVPVGMGHLCTNPILDTPKGQGNLDYIITAPVSNEEMIAPLQEAVDQGTKIVTVDTYLGDGDYINGP